MKKFIKSIWPILLISLTLAFLVAVNSVYASDGGEGHKAEGIVLNFVYNHLNFFGLPLEQLEKWVEFAFKTLDFLILVGFLYWLLAAKIKEFFVGRRKEIKESLENAAKQKAEAEKKYREYSEKIDKASLEIDGIFEMIKEQGFVEKQKIIDDAKKVAEKMKQDAQARIEQELQKASSQLRIEAVQLSVQMAEQILKRNITEKDHESMVKEYMDKVVSKN